MRIALVVTGGVDRSGRERVIPALLSLIERLARRHQVTVYALRYHHAPCSYPLFGATVRDLGRPEGVVAQHCVLHHALRRDGPFDVVHAYWALPAGLAAVSAARRLRLPCVVTLDSGELVGLDDIDYGLQRTTAHRTAVRAVVALATCVTVCSTFMWRMAAARGIVAKRIPIGVDTRRFVPAARPEGPPWRLVHVASLNPVKDQSTLLEAFKRLAVRTADVHLDIVGEDTLGGRIQRLSERLRLAGRVTFHGFVTSDAIRAMYQHAHVNVLSSRHEAASVAVVEAAASGVPTVGTAVGYVADWAPDRAVAVAPGDPDALAAGIADLLEDRTRRARIAAAARAWALAHDADWTAGRMERLYRELVSARQ